MFNISSCLINCDNILMHGWRVKAGYYCISAFLGFSYLVKGVLIAKFCNC